MSKDSGGEVFMKLLLMTVNLSLIHEVGKKVENQPRRQRRNRRCGKGKRCVKICKDDVTKKNEQGK